MTPELLRAVTHCTPEAAARFAGPLTDACAAFDIDTPARLAAFLAQIGHESGGLRHVREVWGPTPAQARYEGRADLGNTQPGDGSRFRGRGLVQTTGRANHARLRARLRARLGDRVPDFETDPEALEEPRWAAWSAADYWDGHNLNALADAGQFELITRRINGGLNGQDDRLVRWERAKAVLATWVPPAAAPAASAPPAPPARPIPMEEAMPIPLAPILAAILPSLISKIPVLSKLPEASQAAAVNVVVEAVGARNAQEAAETLAVDAGAVLAATKALETNWFALLQADPEATSAARDFAVRYAQQREVRTVVGTLTFIEFLSLILVLCSMAGGLAALFWGGIDPQLKGAIVTLILIGGFTGVKEFWLGSSWGSKSKDERPPG